MWRADAACWLLIGAHSVELIAPRSGIASKVQPIEPLGTDPAADARAALLRALDRVLPAAATEVAAAGRAGGELRVLVADTWLSMVTLPWSAELEAEDTAVPYARLQLQSAGFELGEDDLVRIDDAAHQALRTAVAYSRPLLIALREAARRHGLRLRSVLPLCEAAGQHARQRSKGPLNVLAVVEGHVASLFDLRSGRPLPLGHPVPLAAGVQAAAELVRLWRRQVLRDPTLDVSQRLQVLVLTDGAPGEPFATPDPVDLVSLPGPVDGTSSSLARLARASAGVRSALDAIEPTRSLGRLGAVVALASVLVAALSVHRSLDLWWRTEAAEQALAAQVPRAPPARKAAVSRDEQARLAAVNTAIAQLNLPITALLNAVQPPKDIRVGVLGIEVLPLRPGLEPGARGQGLKLNAEALTGVEMARYVDFLAERAPITTAYLVSHEARDTDPGRPLRFTVEAAWQE